MDNYSLKTNPNEAAEQILAYLRNFHSGRETTRSDAAILQYVEIYRHQLEDAQIDVEQYRAAIVAHVERALGRDIDSP